MNRLLSLAAIKLNIIIENQKGSYKSFVDEGKESDYPLKGVIYPVDYGYIEGYMGEDDAELDVFTGSGTMNGYIKVWHLDVPTETKFFVHITQEEYNAIIKAFEPVLVESKILNEVDFETELEKFKQ